MTKDCTVNLPDDIIVYTAVFGGYDTLKPARTASVCITDFKQGAIGWQYRGILLGGTNKEKSFWCKSHPHELFPDAKYSIWHDGNVEMLVTPRDLIRTALKDNDLALFKHPQRKCIYEEGEACVRLHKAKRAEIDTQKEYLKQQGYPKNNGLADTVVVVRRHTPEIEELNELWWNEFNRSPAKRDQMCFNYVCWKLNISYFELQGHPRFGDYFKWTRHKRTKKPEKLQD